MPKEFTGEKLCESKLAKILEAANWAPTHQKNEPWRYVILESSEAILAYFDFLSDWYDSHGADLTEDELSKFRSKCSSLRQDWPHRVSHLVLIGMRRASNPDKKLPEWEEICAVAMSVQNMHLMTASMTNVGGFWSSHTWCKAARDSSELRKAYFGHLLPDPDDRVFGAFVLGKYPEGKEYRSSRTDIASKTVRK